MVLIAGLLANKDAAGVFAALTGAVSRVLTIGFSAAAAADPVALAETARATGLDADACVDVCAALDRALQGAGAPPHLVIAGSLYLAGEVLGMSPQTWPT